MGKAELRLLSRHYYEVSGNNPMNNIYCTLFNVNYLDKGIVLYESLLQVCNEFKLYVLAMDDKCYDILKDMSRPSLIPIKLDDFENDKLREAKRNRGFGEYCWTCSSSLIKYVLTQLNEPICTYIDADMCFYKDPSVLIDEMIFYKAEVLVVGHRFNAFEKREREQISGKICVEFNTFLNTQRAKDLLNIWVDQSISSCSSTTGEGSLGDQMYLSNWLNIYDFVSETQNLGAGVAPWNIKQYKMISSSGNKYELYCQRSSCDLIFYHFENIMYIDKHTANINVYESWGIDHKFVEVLYEDYLKRIDKVKDLLKNTYNLEILIKRHPAKKGETISLQERIKNVFRNITNVKYVKHYLLSSIPKMIYRKCNIIRF